MTHGSWTSGEPALDNGRALFPPEKDLFRIVREPQALIALKASLQRGGPDTWRPSRLILVNYWLFDYEVFHFVQGRLLLRGSNASGKTTVLVSAITLVLDGEKRRERLDTFGGQGRSLAYYLVGEPEATPDSDFYFESRTGYVILEFEHPPTGRYRTIGLGLRTSRSRPDLAVDSWGFIVSDGRRVGIDLPVLDSANQPLTPRQLAEVLGSGGLVVERGSEYREQVNRAIFGFERVEEYEFLLEVLHQLRSPKLNREAKPSLVCEVLSDSLPPLPGGLLDQVARVIQDIDEAMESLEETGRQLQAVEQLHDRYAQYLNQQAQLAAVDYQAAYGAYREAAEQRERAVQALSEAATLLAREEAELQQLRDQLQRLLARKEALEQSEAFKGHESLSWLGGQLAQARESLERARHRESETRQALARLDERIAQQQAAWATYLSELEAQLGTLAAEIDRAAWPAARGPAEAFSRALDSYRARALEDAGGAPAPSLPSLAPVLAELGQARRRLLEGVLRALEEVNRCQHSYQTAAALEDREREALYRLGSEAEQARNRLESSRAEALTAVFGWLEALKEVQPESDERAALTAGIERYPADGFNLAPLLEPVRPALARARDRLENRLRELGLSRDRLRERSEGLRQELDGWLAREEAEPPLTQGQEEARRRLAEAGIPFIPLFRACEPREGLSPASVAQLEGALAEAGLLDALITPREHRARVAQILQEAGLPDRWLEPLDTRPPGARLSGPTLRQVLKPAAAAPWPEDVLAALDSVAWDPRGVVWAAATVSAADPPLAVGPAGFRAGPLVGTAQSRTEPAYLGEANRRRAREAAITRLRAELKDVEARIWEAESAIDQVRGRLFTLEGAWRAGETLPAWGQLYEAARKVERLEGEIRDQQERLEEAVRQSKEAVGRLHAARETHARAVEQVPEAAGRDQEGVRVLLQGTEGVMHQATVLDRDALRGIQIVATYRDLAGDRLRAAGRLAEDQKALAEGRSRVAELDGQVSALRDRLGRLGLSVEEFLRELQRLDQAIKALQREEDERIERVGGLRVRQSALEERSKEAAGRLEACARAEGAAREKLREQLAAYPTLKSVLKLFDEGEEGPSKAAAELLKYRRSAEDRLRESVEESIKQAYRDLVAARQEAQVVLVDLPPTLEGERLFFRRRGLVLQPYEVLGELKDQQARNALILQEKERELYEQVILKDAGNEIRNRLELAHRWREEVNGILRTHPLPNGERLFLQWRPRPADRVLGIDPGRAVELLQRDAETLTDREFDELVDHFRRRVNEVRRRFRERTLDGAFAQALAEVLDYRTWFQFRLMSEAPGEGRRELTDLRFASGSGGQKSLRMFIPLVAAAYARYRGAAADAPRLIGLDEAFAGVDETNTREMFSLLNRLGLCWIMTSEKLWGDFPTVPAQSIYELLRQGSLVSPVWFLWDGRQLQDALNASGVSWADGMEDAMASDGSYRDGGLEAAVSGDDERLDDR